MGMTWIRADKRVPCDRRNVFVWVMPTGPIGLIVEGYGMVSRYNHCTGQSGMFDCERGFSVLGGRRVTHWCEIEQPEDIVLLQPPKKP